MENLYNIGLISIIILILTTSYTVYNISKRNKIRYDVERMRFTKDFLKDLDNTIIMETIRIIKYSTMLDEKMIPRDFDEFISKICDNVYNAYEKKIYKNSNILYNKEYIFRYIHNRTVIVYYEYLSDNQIDGNTGE